MKTELRRAVGEDGAGTEVSGMLTNGRSQKGQVRTGGWEGDVGF